MLVLSPAVNIENTNVKSSQEKQIYFKAKDPNFFSFQH
jgi:hypothetical protein